MIQTAIVECGLDDPSIYGDETVLRVLKNCGFVIGPGTKLENLFQ